MGAKVHFFPLASHSQCFFVFISVQFLHIYQSDYFCFDQSSSMRRIYLLLWFIIAVQFDGFSQPPAMIEGRISGFPYGNILLIRVAGHREMKVGDTKTDNTGAFRLFLSQKPQPGLYRIVLDRTSARASVDLLLTGGNIGFTSSLPLLADSAIFFGDAQNIALHDYRQLKKDAEKKIGILEQILSIYPEDERFYPRVVEEAELLKTEFKTKALAIASQFPRSLLSSYIRSDLPVFPPASMLPSDKQKFLFENFLNNIDFSDSLLLYTDIFASKPLEYVMLFRDGRNDVAQQTRYFIQAADRLLTKAKVEPKVFNYLLDYLINGFEQIGQQAVIDHIARTYEPTEQCLADHESGELQKRMEGYKRLATGNPAPGINAIDITGMPFTLKSGMATHTLVVFYASWCPHCNTMMPQLREIALQANAGNPKNPVLRIIAVSIDSDSTAYQDYIAKNQLNDTAMASFWVNLCDLIGWDGKIASDYYLFATPTLLLLDEDLKISAKPSSAMEVATLAIIKPTGN